MDSVGLGIVIIVGTITVIHMEYFTMAAGYMDSLGTIIDCHTQEVHLHILARVRHHKVPDYMSRTCLNIKKQLEVWCQCFVVSISWSLKS